jgi:flagellar biosynthesis protein FliR
LPAADNQPVLNEIITADIWRFFLIFTRLGAAMMLMPGIGSTLVETRIRLLLALAIAFLLLPTVGLQIPRLPAQPAQVVAVVVGEVMVGGYLGVVTQILVGAISVSGSFISFQTGLTNAFSFDAVAQQQSQLLAGFLTNLAMVVVFSANLHHLMFRAVVDSYELFIPGQLPPFDDFTQSMIHLVSASFAIGVQMAAPVLVFGLVFYTGLGLLSRLVPQMQVFFVAAPLQVLVGLWMVMVGLPVMMLVFLRFFEGSLLPYVVPR